MTWFPATFSFYHFLPCHLGFLDVPRTLSAHSHFWAFSPAVLSAYNALHPDFCMTCPLTSLCLSLTLPHQKTREAFPCSLHSQAIHSLFLYPTLLVSAALLPSNILYIICAPIYVMPSLLETYTAFKNVFDLSTTVSLAPRKPPDTQQGPEKNIKCWRLTYLISPGSKQNQSTSSHSVPLMTNNSQSEGTTLWCKKIQEQKGLLLLSLFFSWIEPEVFTS